MAKRRLKVDLGELELAMQTDSYEVQHYLDLETGEIVLLMEDVTGDIEAIYGEIYDDEGNRIVSLEAYLDEQGYPDWQKEMLLEADRVEQEYRTRYVRVEPGDPHADYRDMERFIPTVEDADLRERLWRAIRGRGAFRYFKDVLLDHPDVRADWFEFKDAQVRRRAEHWLASHDIEPIG